jgi:hypothetical protein
MSKMPLISKEEVFHVGQLDRSLKQKGSLEGSGLSISTEPRAWVKINPFTGGKLFQLVKKENLFLDFYALTEEQEKVMIEWGIKEGHVIPAPIYRITYYDDEMESELCMIFHKKENAEEEAENYEVEIEEEIGFISTSQLEERVMSHSTLIAPLDLLSTLYAEEVLAIDGVWWEEKLDVFRYSAPRGVISNAKLKEWETILIEENCY